MRGFAPLLTAAVVALGACENTGADSAPASDEEVASAGPVRHLGLFTAGDLIDFESCEGVSYGIDGPVIADLISMHEEMVPGLEPFESVFVDIIGEIKEGSRGPELDAIELRRVAYEGGGCDRDDSAVFFRGFGTEPDWSIVIGDDGITWTTPDATEQMPHGGLYDGPRGEWLFDALDAAEQPIFTATIVQTPCVNEMSGAWSHLSISLERDGQFYRGCAYLSPAMETQ